MQKTYLFTLITTMIWLVACQEKATKTKPTFTGYWVCANANDSVMAKHSLIKSPIPPFELVFRQGTDSVFYLNGFEMASFPVKRLNETQYEISGFIRDSISVFTLDTDGYLNFVDGDGHIRFFRADSNLATPVVGKWKSTLQNYYQKQFWAGDYKTTDGKPVSITPAGIVKGFRNWAKLTMVLGSNVAQSDIDMAMLKTTDNQTELLGWKQDGKQLVFYNMNQVEGTQKNRYQAGGELCRFIF
jgi:hypothetical protein